jgi:hypothetical protein
VANARRKITTFCLTGAEAVERSLLNRGSCAATLFGQRSQLSLGVIRTENEELRITVSPGCCGFWCFPASPCGFERRGKSHHRARSGVSIAAAARENKSTWLLRPSGSFGSGRCEAARPQALSNSGAQRIVKRSESYRLGGCMVGSIGLPQLLAIFLAVLIVWAVYRPRGPFSR